MSAIFSLWGYLSLLQLLQMAVLGERGMATTAHICRRRTVYAAWVAVGWLLFLALLTTIRGPA